MTVIPFPVKKQIKLTEEQEKRIEAVAKDYVNVLDDIINSFGVATITDDELQEVMNLVLLKMLESFEDCLN